jgi:hypothetical protein
VDRPQSSSVADYHEWDGFGTDLAAIGRVLPRGVPEISAA